MRAPIVAAIQYAPKLMDVNANIQTAQQMSFEAAAKGASLVVLPELCTSGYALQNKREAMECAQVKNGFQTEAFLPITKRFNTHIVLGYIELFEGKLYNSAAVIGPNGVIANVRKHNLWGPDQLWAEAAEDMHPVVTTPVGRLGVLICRDVMNNYRDSYKFYRPEQRFYKAGSVDTIALLSNWGSDYGFPDSSWVELAEETRANVVVSNRVGEERDLKFKGGSVVIDRNKKIYSFGSSFTEAAVVGGIVVV